VIVDSLSHVWECDDLVASDSDFVHEPDLDSLFFDSILPSSASLSAFAARFTPPLSATSPVPSLLLPSSDGLTLHSISGDSLPDSPLDDPLEVPDLDDRSDHGDDEQVEGVEEWDEDRTWSQLGREGVSREDGWLVGYFLFQVPQACAHCRPPI
jgi:hypothetical protein